MILHHIHNQNVRKNRNTDKHLFSSHLDFRKLLINLLKVSYTDDTPNRLLLYQTFLIRESLSSEVMENMIISCTTFDLSPYPKYRTFFQTYPNTVLVRHMLSPSLEVNSHRIIYLFHVSYLFRS